jgi:O-antigen/teichoic acid export membrane protein
MSLSAAESVAVPVVARGHSGGLRRMLAMSSTGTMGARVLGALGGLFAARLLGPAGRGELAIVVLLAMGTSSLVAAGVQVWVAREVARSGGVRVARWVVPVHVLVMSVACGALGIVLSAVGLATGVSMMLVWLGVGLALSNAVQLLALGLPLGVRAMGICAVVMIVAGVVYAGANALLFFVDDVSISLVLLGMVAGNLVSILIVMAWMPRAAEGTAPVARGRTSYVSALRFGLPAGLGDLVLFAMFRIDVLLVAAFLPLADVGWYAVATSLTEMLWVIPDSVANVVMPTTASNPEASPTTRLLRASLVATFGAGLALVLVAPWLTGALFGADFRPAAQAVPFLALAALAGTTWKVVIAEVTALGHTRPRLTSAIVGLVTMLLVDLVTIPALGIAGAALGSAVAYTAAAVLVVRAWSRYTDRSVADLLGLVRRRAHAEHGS